MNVIKTIAPGQVVPILKEGRNFYVVFSPVDIEIARPGEGFVSYPQGTGLDSLPDGGTFNRLEVRNPSLGEITIVLYIGGPLFRDSRAAIIEPRIVPVVDATTSLAGGGTVTLSGVPSGLRIRRKAVLVTNKDQNNDIEIRDSGTAVIATVFPRQTYTLPISETVKVHNPTGGAIAVNISELWWTL